MLQVLYMDASKVDRVLHMMECNPSAAAGGGVRGQTGRRRHVGSGGAQTPHEVGRYVECRRKNRMQAQASECPDASTVVRKLRTRQQEKAPVSKIEYITFDFQSVLTNYEITTYSSYNMAA
jgi:hypothetical protein